MSPTGGLPAPLPAAEHPLVVIAPEPCRCAECGMLHAAGDLVHYEGERPLCLGCGLLVSLEFLPSGDVALTRRASGHSRHYAPVLAWSRVHKRWERRGTLVEREALRRARAECAADSAVRGRQRAAAALRRAAEDRVYMADFARMVRTLYPGCPLAEAREIAAHACERRSGRVGRTAAARELDPEKVRLAVIAHVRHLHTDYDGIIARTRDKRASRARIKDGIEAVLQSWQRRDPAACGAATR